MLGLAWILIDFMRKQIVNFRLSVARAPRALHRTKTHTQDDARNGIWNEMMQLDGIGGLVTECVRSRQKYALRWTLATKSIIYL